MSFHRHISLIGILGTTIILQGCASDDAATPDKPLRVAGFSTPESVLHDAERDVYLVSNIQGSPIDKDDNGFISRVSPDGEILEARWIDGASSEVTLNAPKGMTLSNGKLYVADIDAVRVFDAASGAAVASVEVPGATFLNDVKALPDGRILISDSGLTLQGADFAPTGSDALLVLDQEGNVAKVVADPSLQHPNGVEWADDESWTCYFGSNAIDAFDAAGANKQHVTLPGGQLDGLVSLGGGQFLVSSWETSAIYKVALGAGGDPAVSQVASGLDSPADIGFDSTRSRVLVPLLSSDEVVLLDLE